MRRVVDRDLLTAGLAALIVHAVVLAVFAGLEVRRAPATASSGARPVIRVSLVDPSEAESPARAPEEPAQTAPPAVAEGPLVETEVETIVEVEALVEAVTVTEIEAEAETVAEPMRSPPWPIFWRTGAAAVGGPRDVTPDAPDAPDEDEPPVRETVAASVPPRSLETAIAATDEVLPAAPKAETLPVAPVTGGTPTAPTTDVTPATPTPPAIVPPRAIQNRPPAYPSSAQRRGYDGTVELSVHVRADGSCGAVEIVSTSGHVALDRAAVRAVRRWRFEPATEDGRAVDRWIEIPIEFSLQDD